MPLPFSITGELITDINNSFTACACGDKFALAGKFKDKERLIEGVVMRDIHPFTAPHNERAADSGNTATPMPLAIAAVSVAIDSISPMTFAVSRRRKKPHQHEV
ncbi:hypothetical protein MUTS15_43080 [Escherichia coli]|nr:hypothetical protein MUTS15_43080 [Escherichia coli]